MALPDVYDSFVEAKEEDASYRSPPVLSAANQSVNAQIELARLRIKQLEIEERIELARMAQRNQMTTTQTPAHCKQQMDKSLRKFAESEDLENYLLVFEATAEKSNIPKGRWSSQLLYKLTTELRDVMIAQGIANCEDYDHVKAQLLKYAGYVEETYRKKWDSLTPKGDNFREFAMTLRRTLESWMKSSNTTKTF